jgi:hypothetical protein
MLFESVHQLDCKCLSCAEEREMLTDKQMEEQDLEFLKHAQDNDIEIP